MQITIEELSTLTSNHNRTNHPLRGKRVLAVIPHGFIHFGTLDIEDGVMLLRDASNLRYWEKRDGGLPEFTMNGPKNGDKIDKIGTVYLGNILFFYPLGDWS